MNNGSSKQQRQPSPSSSTTSMSVAESNVLTAASVTEDVRDQSSCCTLKRALKLDGDGDAEVQSPDRGLLESLFADQLDFGADFMISSPRRDFMVCSPRRGDFMLISSPKGDFMVSSPRRDHYMMMVSSPKREYGMVVSPRRAAAAAAAAAAGNYVHGLHGPPPVIHQAAYNAAGYGVAGGVKAASPLQKVSNSSSSALYASYSSAAATDQFLHGESLALSAVDAFLEDYGREGYELHPSLLKSSVDGGGDGGGGAEAGAAALPSLLDCFVMESRYDQSSEMLGSRIHLGGEHDDMYQNFGGGGGDEYPELQQKPELDHGFLSSVGNDNSGETNITAAGASAVQAPYQVMVGDAFSVMPPENEQEQDSGLQLVHLLLACAEAIAKDDFVAARRYLHQLNRVVYPLGDSMQRVASCFADALADRLNHNSPSPSSSSSSSSSSSTFALRKQSSFPPPALDVLKIYQIIYQACPYIKFAHFTANQAIFEAFESEDCVHVIDLDILQGYQWPAFLQALAARPGGAPALRITGVGHPAEAVRETGRHLAELAHSLRVPFEFHPAAVERLEDLRPSMLHRRVGEALAVNSVNRLHRVPGVHLGPLLAMIRGQAPKIFTLVEQEASHNGPYFLGRFLEALHYYSAIFDSLDATFPADSAARAKVEQFLLAPEIKNIVASEGSERTVRHERLERWRRVIEGRGFKGVPLSTNAVNQSKILLGLYPCDGYRLTEDKGCLLLGWQDRPLIAASAWRC